MLHLVSGATWQIKTSGIHSKAFIRTFGIVIYLFSFIYFFGLHTLCCFRLWQYNVLCPSICLCICLSICTLKTGSKFCWIRYWVINMCRNPTFFKPNKPRSVMPRQCCYLCCYNISVESVWHNNAGGGFSSRIMSAIQCTLSVWAFVRLESLFNLGCWWLSLRQEMCAAADTPLPFSNLMLILCQFFFFLFFHWLDVWTRPSLVL